MSSHVSSGGWSGVVSIAASSALGADVEAAESGALSALLAGGCAGGCEEDMVRVSERAVEGQGTSEEQRDASSSYVSAWLLIHCLPPVRHQPFLPPRPAAMADADDQARYEAAKKDLIQALAKKRAIDKELVRPPPSASAIHL